jgi:hypothetical protein
MRLPIVQQIVPTIDLLNDWVLPLFEHHELSMLRILTGRGAKYCGRAEKHDYELCLALNDMKHTKTKVKSPHTYGICKRCHKIILQDDLPSHFPQEALR